MAENQGNDSKRFWSGLKPNMLFAIRSMLSIKVAFAVYAKPIL
jgi:hypothetical protein